MVCLDGSFDQDELVRMVKAAIDDLDDNVLELHDCTVSRKLAHSIYDLSCTSRPWFVTVFGFFPEDEEALGVMQHTFWSGQFRALTVHLTSTIVSQALFAEPPEDSSIAKASGRGFLKKSLLTSVKFIGTAFRPDDVPSVQKWLRRHENVSSFIAMDVSFPGGGGGFVRFIERAHRDVPHKPANLTLGYSSRENVEGISSLRDWEHLRSLTIRSREKITLRGQIGALIQLQELKLDLRNCEIEETGLIELLQDPERQLEGLHMCGFTFPIDRALGCLPLVPGLVDLSIQGSNIGRDGTEFLIRYIERPSPIKHLSLSTNALGEDKENSSRRIVRALETSNHHLVGISVTDERRLQRQLEPLLLYNLAGREVLSMDLGGAWPHVLARINRVVPRLHPGDAQENVAKALYFMVRNAATTY